MPINESPSKPASRGDKKKRPQAPRGESQNTSRPSASNSKPTPPPTKHKSQPTGLLKGLLNLKQRFIRLFTLPLKSQSQKKKTGVVKFFNRSKGFGFIQEDNGNEIYVHISGLQSRVRENDKVTFVAQHGKKGLSAVQVTRV